MSWENVLKKNCGCGEDPCKTYGMIVEVKKGKGERHFYLKDGKPVQWTGETHKHPDGTLMSGKEHVEGESKKLYHFYELSQEALKHLSKETTVIKAKLSAEAMQELKGHMKNVADTIRVIQEQFRKTPRTEKNQEDHDAMKRTLRDIAKRLVDFRTYLDDLFMMEDFEFEDVKEFDTMLDKI